MKKLNNLVLEDVRILFRNFSGAEGKFNEKGKRNFCVALDTDLANQLELDGYNIKWLRPRDDDEEAQAYIQVAVRFDNFPPKVVMISSRGKTVLDEETCGILDWAEIANVDLIINPSSWNVNGKDGVKAYLKSIYVTIAEDVFEKKYEEPAEGDILPVGDLQCDKCANLEDCQRHGECGGLGIE